MESRKVQGHLLERFGGWRSWAVNRCLGRSNPGDPGSQGLAASSEEGERGCGPAPTHPHFVEGSGGIQKLLLLLREMRKRKGPACPSPASGWEEGQEEMRCVTPQYTGLSSTHTCSQVMGLTSYHFGAQRSKREVQMTFRHVSG